jgi:hypothetical protein
MALAINYAADYQPTISVFIELRQTFSFEWHYAIDY